MAYMIQDDVNSEQLPDIGGGAFVEKMMQGWHPPMSAPRYATRDLQAPLEYPTTDSPSGIPMPDYSRFDDYDLNVLNTPKHTGPSAVLETRPYEPEVANIDYVKKRDYKVVPLDFNNRIEAMAVTKRSDYSKTNVPDIYKTKYEYLPDKKSDTGKGSRAYIMTDLALGEVEGRTEQADKVGKETFDTWDGITERDYNPKILGKKFKDLTREDRINYLVKQYYKDGIDDIEGDGLAYKLYETLVWIPEVAKSTMRMVLRDLGHKVRDDTEIKDMVSKINSEDPEMLTQAYMDKLWGRVQTWSLFPSYKNGWPKRVYFNPFQRDANPMIADRHRQEREAIEREKELERQSKMVTKSKMDLTSPSFMLQAPPAGLFAKKYLHDMGE